MPENAHPSRRHSRGRTATLIGLAAATLLSRASVVEATEAEREDETAARRPNIVYIMADDNSYV